MSYCPKNPIEDAFNEVLLFALVAGTSSFVITKMLSTGVLLLLTTAGPAAVTVLALALLAAAAEVARYAETEKHNA